MGILTFLVIALILGIVVWFIHAKTPIPQVFKTVILWVAVIFLILLALHAFGIIGQDIAIPKLR